MKIKLEPGENIITTPIGTIIINLETKELTLEGSRFVIRKEV